MDEQMDELSIFSMFTIVCEMIWRMEQCDATKYSKKYFKPYVVFISSYLVCATVALLDFKHIQLFQSTGIRNIFSLLHAIDPLTALTLGIGIYYERMDIVSLSVAASTKLGLLSFVTRMITGKASKTKLDTLLETTRAYLHHGIWRCLTLLGHALVASKIKSGKSSLAESRERYIQLIAYLRQSLLVLIILSCMILPWLRREFALSAVGHVSYLTVRFGSIFRIGSTYLSKPERENWQQLTDFQKLCHLFRLDYPWLCIELGLLLGGVLYFSYLRLSTYGIVVDSGLCIIS